jgi:hypothetical protein
MSASAVAHFQLSFALVKRQFSVHYSTMLTAFLHLLWHAVQVTINDRGTTLIVTAVGFLASAVQLGVQTWRQRKHAASLFQAFRARLGDWTSYVGAAFSIVAWVCVFVYTTASIVYEEHVSMRDSIASLTKAPQADGPAFQRLINDTGVFPAGDKTNSGFMIVGTIFNQGTAGNLRNLSVEVVFNNGRRIVGEIANPPDPRMNIGLGRNTQGHMMMMPGRLYWLNETSISIPKFGSLNGFVMGLLRGVTYKESEEKFPTFVLTCTDTKASILRHSIS